MDTAPRMKTMKSTSMDCSCGAAEEHLDGLRAAHEADEEQLDGHRVVVKQADEDRLQGLIAACGAAGEHLDGFRAMYQADEEHLDGRLMKSTSMGASPCTKPLKSTSMDIASS